MTQGRRGWVVGLVAALMIGYAAAGDAVEFTWNQAGGFALGTGSLTGGPLGPGGFPGPANAGHGGLEFFGLQTAPPAPAGTYRSISWGCVADGDNSGGVTNCANGGVVGEAVVGADPTGEAGRSSLISTRYDNPTSPAPLAPIGPLSFSADGVLRDDGLWVVIARLDHLNRIIDNEGNYLGGVSILSNLTIDATPPFDDPTNTVPITFTETLNTALADCTAPNPLGSACDDVFTFDASDFSDTSFTSNGVLYALQFTLSPVPECSQVLSTVGTLTVFQCSDSPDHRVAIDFANGLAYAQEGFDNAFMTLMRIEAIPGPCLARAPRARAGRRARLAGARPAMTDLSAIRARHAAMAARDWRGGAEVQMHEDIGALLDAARRGARQDRRPPRGTVSEDPPCVNCIILTVEVARLQAVLDAAQAAYWRRRSLTAWRARIERAALLAEVDAMRGGAGG